MTFAFWLATCLATGLAIRLLRRWPRLVFAATLLGAVLLLATLAVAPDEPVDLVGRALVLDLPARVFLWAAVATTAALAFFGPLTFERAGDAPAIVIANAQGAFFFWSLAPLGVAITLDSFPLATFFWALSLIALIFLAQSHREGRAGGAAQFLLLVVLATASLLLSNRFFDLYPLTPDRQALVRSAFLFLVWGLGLLLAVVPLHIWLGPLADEITLLGTAFLVGVAQPVGLWLLFQLMTRVTWLVEKSPLLNVLVAAGIVTLPVGALIALSERRDGRFLAYLSLVSLGHALIGFGLGTRVGLAGAILAMLNRAIGVTLLAGGLSFTQYHPERRWQTVGTAAMLAGGFALAGIPPALGWAAGWSLYRDLDPAVLALLCAANAAVLLATIRVAWARWAERTEEACPESFDMLRTGSVEGFAETGEVKVVPYLCAAVVAALLVALVVIGVFPQLVADPLIAALGKAEYLK